MMRSGRRCVLGVLLATGLAVSGVSGQFPVSIPLDSLDGSDGFALVPVVTSNGFGLAASGVGDVNGDGFDDFAVSDVSGTALGRSYCGLVHIVFGSASVGASGSLTVPTGSPNRSATVVGAVSGDRIGTSVSGVGDVNGDGFDDLLVGVKSLNNYDGAAFLVFGRKTWAANVDLSILSTSRSMVFFDSTGEYGYLGERVSGAGDVNGDGFADMLVGAKWEDSTAGRAHVVFGGAGFAPGGVFDVDTLDGTNGVQIRGINSGDYLGCSVSGAGDVDGDGFDDVIVGAWGVDSPGGSYYQGSSYVVFGGPTFGGAVVDPGTLDGVAGVRVRGAGSSDFSGYSVGTAGDVDGDGLADVIVGAPESNGTGATPRGAGYVVFGSALSAGAAEVALENIDGTDAVLLEGVAVQDRAGHWASSAGDIDGDGFTDALLGAPFRDTAGGAEAGEGTVVFGSELSGTAGVLLLGSLAAGEGFHAEGFAGGQFAGAVVHHAGDINGDGISDIVMGTYQGDGAWVIFGRQLADSATYRTHFADGNAPARPVGGIRDGSSSKALSGVTVNYPAGVASGPDAVTVHRDGEAMVSGITPVGHAWEVASNRTGLGGGDTTELWFQLPRQVLEGSSLCNLAVFRASSAAGPWTAAAGNLVDGNRWRVRAQVTGDPSGFYVVTSLDDEDGDGKADTLETTDTATLTMGGSMATNTILPDSDGDGLLDGEESLCALTVPGPLVATNPRLRDTDSDGFGDKLEYMFPQFFPNGPLVMDSGPALADGDGDGLPLVLDPNNADSDSDNDGYKDEYEFVRGYSPTNAADIPPLGDVDGDGDSDVDDVALLANSLLGSVGLSAPRNADVSISATIDLSDLTALANARVGLTLLP